MSHIDGVEETGPRGCRQNSNLMADCYGVYEHVGWGEDNDASTSRPSGQVWAELLSLLPGGAGKSGRPARVLKGRHSLHGAESVCLGNFPISYSLTFRNRLGCRELCAGCLHCLVRWPWRRSQTSEPNLVLADNNNLWHFALCGWDGVRGYSVRPVPPDLETPWPLG